MKNIIQKLNTHLVTDLKEVEAGYRHIAPSFLDASSSLPFRRGFDALESLKHKILREPSITMVNLGDQMNLLLASPDIDGVTLNVYKGIDSEVEKFARLDHYLDFNRIKQSI